jgi:hypothetical protein
MVTNSREAQVVYNAGKCYSSLPAVMQVHLRQYVGGATVRTGIQNSSWDSAQDPVPPLILTAMHRSGTNAGQHRSATASHRVKVVMLKVCPVAHPAIEQEQQERMFEEGSITRKM